MIGTVGPSSQPCGNGGAGAGANSKNQIEEYLVENAPQSVFVLPNPATKVTVFLDGITQSITAGNYTFENGTTVTLIEPAPIGSVILMIGI